MNWMKTITKIPIYVYQSSTDGKKYIYNGIEMSVAPLDFSVSNNLSIILFARQTTNVNRHSKSKIEFFKIYENGKQQAKVCETYKLK